MFTYQHYNYKLLTSSFKQNFYCHYFLLGWSLGEDAYYLRLNFIFSTCVSLDLRSWRSWSQQQLRPLWGTDRSAHRYWLARSLSWSSTCQVRSWRPCLPLRWRGWCSPDKRARVYDVRKRETLAAGIRSDGALTLLSSFFMVTRSRDLREWPLGAMKYRQMWILVSWQLKRERFIFSSSSRYLSNWASI